MAKTNFEGKSKVRSSQRYSGALRGLAGAELHKALTNTLSTENNVASRELSASRVF